MGYFPFFIDIKGKKCIIVGGGNVAARKIEKLLPFEPYITVIAPEISDDITSLNGIKIIKRKFRDEDIDSAFFVSSLMHIYLNFAEKKIFWLILLMILINAVLFFRQLFIKMILPSGFPPPVRVRYLRHIYA